MFWWFLLRVDGCSVLLRCCLVVACCLGAVLGGVLCAVVRWVLVTCWFWFYESVGFTGLGLGLEVVIWGLGGSFFGSGRVVF